MRVSKEQKEKTKQNILKAAGQGFREEGYGSLGVDGLSKRAGLTSGAFYNHFSSKEEAFKEALIQGLKDYADGIKNFESEYGDTWLQEFIDYYLGEKHRNDLACSCALPALSPDAMRGNKKIKEAYEKEVQKIAATVTERLNHGSKEDAWALMSILAGSVIISRSVSDPTVAKNISNAARSWIEKIIK